jgi:hypothetical protein
MDNRPWPWWLRRFYWFENSLWRLNEIKDLNVGSFGTTKMEFIKVQDPENYKLEKIEYQGHNELVITTLTIPSTGGTAQGYMFEQSAGGWFAGDYVVGEDGQGNKTYLESAEVMHPSTGRGQYITNFTIDIPENTGDTPITWTVSVEDDFDRWYSDTFTQEPCYVPSTLTIVPTATTVPSYATTANFTISYSNVSNIMVVSDSLWAAPTRNGNTITVACSSNNTASERTATITVTGTGSDGPITVTATITQNGLGQISAVPDNIVFDYNDFGDSFDIITDDDWTSTINDN